MKLYGPVWLHSCHLENSKLTIKKNTFSLFFNTLQQKVNAQHTIYASIFLFFQVDIGLTAMLITMQMLTWVNILIIIIIFFFFFFVG